jgi:hypothetical protein
LAIHLSDVNFIGATGGPEKITLLYAGEGLNGTILLSEERASSPVQPWQVGASATVESVSVGEATGEYVQGSWFSIDANDGVAWNPDEFVQTLRWEAKGIRYTMVFHAGKMGTGILLDKTTMLDLASHLTIETIAEEPTPSMDIQQLTALAGFPVLEPAWLPVGYIFLDTTYSAEYQTACLYYSLKGGDNSPVLAIAEIATDKASILDNITTTVVQVDGQEVEIPIVTESLSVGGADGGQAVLASNGVNAGNLCPYQNFVSNRALFWRANGKSFVIFGLLDQYQGGAFVSRLEMQHLAESLNGVITIPADVLDPERLRFVEEAETLAGFDVKAPTQMISGVQFDHAVIVDFDQLREVRLIYTLGTPTRGGIDYGFFITQGTGAIRTLEEVYGWGGYEYVSIDGQTALYRKALCWDAVGENGVLSGNVLGREWDWL